MTARRFVIIGAGDKGGMVKGGFNVRDDVETVE